jgi:YggT family protein
VSLFLRNLFEALALALSVLVLGRVLVSWFDARGRSQLSVFLFRATEPILGPVRRLLPPMGMLDLSPMIVLIVLSLVLQALR